MLQRLHLHLLLRMPVQLLRLRLRALARLALTPGGAITEGKMTMSKSRRPVCQLAADRQARYARYCNTARSGAFGPAAHLGLCTLTDTLDVLGLDVDELEQRALEQLAAGDPLIVAVVDELLNRAARNPYDPVRYVATPSARHLRAIPGNPSSSEETDTRR